jgi:hypothetical protein
MLLQKIVPELRPCNDFFSLPEKKQLRIFGLFYKYNWYSFQNSGNFFSGNFYIFSVSHLTEYDALS